MGSRVSHQIISAKEFADLYTNLDNIIKKYSKEKPENKPRGFLRTKTGREMTLDEYAEKIKKVTTNEHGEEKLKKLLGNPSQVTVVLETRNTILQDILDTILDFIAKRLNPGYQPLTYETFYKNNKMKDLQIDIDRTTYRTHKMLEPIKEKASEVMNSISALGDKILDHLAKGDETTKDNIKKTAIVTLYALLSLAVAAITLFSIITSAGIIGAATAAFAGLTIEATILSYTRQTCLDIADQKGDPSFKFDTIVGKTVAGVLDTILSPIAKLYDITHQPYLDISEKGIEQRRQTEQTTQELSQKTINKITEEQKNITNHYNRTYTEPKFGRS